MNPRQSGAYFIPRGPIPRYRQYHRPIDSPEHFGCNRFIAPIRSDERHCGKRQEENGEYYFRRGHGEDCAKSKYLNTSAPPDSRSRLRVYVWVAPHFHERGNMDHNEAVRKFEHLMLRGADQAHEAATELEALAALLPSEKSRQLAQVQAKASYKRAKAFRELAQKVKES
jgi:hypothetical protein